jgi:hypothetical protein
LDSRPEFVGADKLATVESEQTGPCIQSKAILDERSGQGHSSLLQNAPLLVLTLIIVGNLWQKTDPDLWGHIRFGQMMLSARHIVSHDQYSYTAYNHSWRDHEYLTEIIMAAIYDAAGIAGLKLWKLVCVASTIFFLIQGLAETGSSSLIQLTAVGFAIEASAQFTQFRPQVHSYLLFALTLALLSKDNYRSSRALWLMVPVMWLWSNLHGGFVVGLIALVIYAGAVVSLALYNRRSLWHAGQVAAVAATAAAATLLPNGLTTWRALLTTIRDPTTFKIFTEWQPLSNAIAEQWRFNHYGIIIYLFLAALWVGLILSVALRPYGADFPLILIAAVMGLAALKSVRNMPFAAMACAIPVARHLDLLLDSRRNKSRTRGMVPAWAQYALAVAALLLTNREIVSPQLETDMSYPASAVDFMKQYRLHGNVLVYFCWGEYLIWHLAPDSKVFFDSRYDMVYPSRVTDDYLAFYWGLPGADRALTNYRTDFVLFPTTEKVYDRMIRAPGWRLMYRDRDAALFARKDSRSAQLRNFPIEGKATTLQHFP